MVPVSVSGYVLVVLAIGLHRGINMIDCCMSVVCVVCKCVHECMYMCVHARWCVSMHACLCAPVCVCAFVHVARNTSTSLSCCILQTNPKFGRPVSNPIP